MQRNLLITEASLMNHHALKDIKSCLESLPESDDTLCRKAFINPLLAYAKDYFLICTEKATSEFLEKAEIFNFIVACTLDTSVSFKEKSLPSIRDHLSKYRYRTDDTICLALDSASSAYKKTIREIGIKYFRNSVNEMIENGILLLKATPDVIQALREKLSTSADKLMKKHLSHSRELPIETLAEKREQFSAEFSAILVEEINTVYAPLRQQEIVEQTKRATSIIGMCSATLSAACWAYDYPVGAITFGIGAGIMLFHPMRNQAPPISSIERVECRLNV